MELTLSLPLPARTPSQRVQLFLPMTEREASDGELIQRIGDGDRDAFESLYRRYARPVFGLALRRLRDRGRAEDAVQETFASVWRSAGSYRPSAGPVPLALRGRPERDRRPDPRERARQPSGRRPRRHPRRRPGRARRPTGSPGAFTAPSPSCPRRSAACSSSRTGAGCRRARSPTSSASRSVPSRPAPAAALARLADALEGGARVNEPPDFYELDRRGRPREERARLERMHDMLVARRPAAGAPAGARRADAPCEDAHDSSWLSSCRARGGRSRARCRRRAAGLRVGYVLGSHRARLRRRDFTVAMGAPLAASRRPAPCSARASRRGRQLAAWSSHVAGLEQPCRTATTTRSSDEEREAGRVVRNVHGSHEGTTTVRMNAPYDFEDVRRLDRRVGPAARAPRAADAEFRT